MASNKSKATLFSVPEVEAVQKLGASGLTVAIQHGISEAKSRAEARGNALIGIKADAKQFYAFVKQSGGISTGGAGTVNTGMTKKGIETVKRLAIRQYSDNTEQLFGSAGAYASFYVSAFIECAGWGGKEFDSKIVETALKNPKGKEGAQAINAMIAKVMGKEPATRGPTKKDKALFSAWLGAVSKMTGKGHYTKQEFKNAVNAVLDTVPVTKM